MVLLFNVFVTNKSATGGQWESLGVGYDRGNLNTPDKLDILKYSLASYASAYPWKRAILNLEIDPEYISLDRKKELEDFVRHEFSNTELYFSDIRNVTQEDWKKTYELINDDMIFYQGNHDHIFIDSSIDYLKELVDLRKEYGPNLSISTSHFPEAIRTAKCGYMGDNEHFPQNPSIDYEVKQNHAYRKGKMLDSLIIITKEIYEDWFLEKNWDDLYRAFPPTLFKSGHVELPRTEGVGIIGLEEIKRHLNSPLIEQKIVIPFKELFRHFDGYYHQKISNYYCPAIDIPPGFFDNKIKVRYGYDDYKEGWVNINPKSENYYAYDISGVDYKFTLEDIPLFWKSRICEVDSNPEVNEEEMIQYKLKSILEMIYTNCKYDPHIDKELETRVLSKYLESHPEYQL